MKDRKRGTRLRMTDGGAFVQDDATLRFEVFDQLAGCSSCQGLAFSRAYGELTGVSSSFEYPNALFHGRTRVSGVVRGVDRREKGNVNAKGLGSEFARLADGDTQCLGRGLGKRRQYA